MSVRTKSRIGQAASLAAGLGAARARILVVVQFPPYPEHINGGATRFAPVIDYLAARHDVQVVLVWDEPYELPASDVPDWLRRMLVVRRRSSRMPRVIRRLRAEASYQLGFGPPPNMSESELIAMRDDIVGVMDRFAPDVILWGLGGHALAHAVHAVRPESRWFLDYCNSASLACHRIGRSASVVNRVRQFEQKLVDKVDGCSFISEVDAAFTFEGSRSSKVQVLPNGVRLPTAADLEPQPERSFTAELGFMGHMGFGPNVDAALRLHRVYSSLLPRRPGLRLKLIGHYPAPEVAALATDLVRVTGAVPNKWTEMAAVGMFVFPLKQGSGLQNKLLEAWALGKPVIASMQVAKPAGAVDGEHLLIADSEEEIAAAIERVLDDPDLARRIGAAGRERVLENFDWSEILPRYEKAVLGR